MGSLLAPVIFWLMYTSKVYLKIDLDKYLIKVNNWQYTSKRGWIITGISCLSMYCILYGLLKGE